MEKAFQRSSAFPLHLVSCETFTKKWHKVPAPHAHLEHCPSPPTATSRKREGGERAKPSAGLMLSPCGVGVLFAQPPQSVLFLVCSAVVGVWGFCSCGTSDTSWFHDCIVAGMSWGRSLWPSSVQHHPLGFKKTQPF